MIVNFEMEFAKLIDLMPPLIVSGVDFKVNYMFGNADEMAKYLTLQKKRSFPLVFCVLTKQNNDTESEMKVTKQGKIVILSESQSPAEFNPYQFEFDYKFVLQPILNKLLKALKVANRITLDFTNFDTENVPKFSMIEVDKNLVYVCNAIVLESEFTIRLDRCLQENSIKKVYGD